MSPRLKGLSFLSQSSRPAGAWWNAAISWVGTAPTSPNWRSSWPGALMSNPFILAFPGRRLGVDRLPRWPRSIR